MKIYCDTDTLSNNIRNEPAELAALQHLLADHHAGRIVMYRSRVDLRELMDTSNTQQQQKLRADYEALEPIPKDEKVHGFHTQTDPYGGCITSPLVSDVQDEAICKELEQRGLTRRDAQHITQAVCNGCDVFLTRDRNTIIKRHRAWLETRFPIKVCLPSEVVRLNSHLAVPATTP